MFLRFGDVAQQREVIVTLSEQRAEIGVVLRALEFGRRVCPAPIVDVRGKGIDAGDGIVGMPNVREVGMEVGNVRFGDLHQKLSWRHGVSSPLLRLPGLTGLPKFIMLMLCRC